MLPSGKPENNQGKWIRFLNITMAFLGLASPRSEEPLERQRRRVLPPSLGVGHQRQAGGGGNDMFVRWPFGGARLFITGLGLMCQAGGGGGGGRGRKTTCLSGGHLKGPFVYFRFGAHVLCSPFFPTADSFGVSAQIGSGVVRGGPEVRFHKGSTRVLPGFHEGSTRFCEGCGVVPALKRSPHAVGDIA